MLLNLENTVSRRNFATYKPIQPILKSYETIPPLHISLGNTIDHASHVRTVGH